MVNHELPEYANPPIEPEVESEEIDFRVRAHQAALENGSGVSTFVARIATGQDEAPFSGGENPPRMSRQIRKPHSGTAHAIGTDRDVYLLQSSYEPKQADGIPMSDEIRTQRIADVDSRISEKITTAEQQGNTSEVTRLLAVRAKRESDLSNTLWARTHK